MSTTEETWLPVPGFEGHYEASDQGRVRSLTRLDGNGQRRNGCILKPHTFNGYFQVKLRVGGQANAYSVHRLILTTFVRPPLDGDVGRHLNDCRQDNRLTNLAWGSHSDNRVDAVRNGGHRGANQTRCKSGHPLSGPNVKIRVTETVQGEARTRRICRACARISDKAPVSCVSCRTELQRHWVRMHLRRRHPELSGALR